MQDLRLRTRQFALRIIKLYRALPRTGDATVLGNQLLRSGTSVGAHYREAFRAKSSPYFISKCEGALQELDETQYWLELISDSGLIKPSRLSPLTRECEELIAMFVTMVTNAKRKTSRS